MPAGETSGHLWKPVYPFGLCGPQHSSREYFLLFYYLNVNTKLISFQSFAVLVYPYDNDISSKEVLTAACRLNKKKYFSLDNENIRENFTFIEE